jgi:MazG family protein
MEAFDTLVAIMARLRAPGGCPWDREQTHESIRKYVIEEAYEVAEAIDRGEPRELCSELGDLLLQVVFHAEMAREAGRFDVDDVCTTVAEKLRRRHPHVFGDVSVSGAGEVVRNWEMIKAEERGPEASAIDGVPRSLPALQRAERIGEKAARVGFDWSDANEVLAKVDEERRELGAALAAGDRSRTEAELGDLLFAVANLARKLDVEPEKPLARAVDRFAMRFRHVEAGARAAGEDLAKLDARQLDDRWRAAKAALGS